MNRFSYIGHASYNNPNEKPAIKSISFNTGRYGVNNHTLRFETPISVNDAID